MPSKVTQRQIAKLANVSIPTVSRVLNQSAPVGQAIEKRVRDAAARLGVAADNRPNHRVLAFLLGNRPITHPFHMEVIAGAEACCAEHDYHMLFFKLRYPLWTQLTQLPIPRLLERRGILDGFIVAGVNSTSMIELLAQTRLPISVFGSTIVEDDFAGYPIVRVDEIGGSQDMTRYLLSLGHTAIWFVGNTRMPWVRRRYEAYCSVMEATGLQPSLSQFDSEDERRVGYLATKQALDQQGPATAIFAANDNTARGVYDALRDRGIGVGEQISVVGFNDTLEAVILHPALTTVRVHAEQVGRQLAELVLSQIKSGSTAPKTITIPTRLIKRESCAALPSNNSDPVVAASQHRS
jgi:DNA-binding LacI/PurR family transcriptional regulator